MKFNRSKHLRNIIQLAGGDGDHMFIRGPRNAFGKRGEVSYVFAYTRLSDERKQLIVDSMKDIYPDIGLVKAYVTKRVSNGWSRSMGGNIKFVFNTRADGAPA